jgi:uncharacterized damage-inducible protein DinB
MRTSTSTISAVAAMCLAGSLSAQDLQNTVNGDLEDLERKYVSLAEAFPQERYSWRPMDGVRSVSEVLMHVVAANFAIPLRVGAELPEGARETWLADPDSFTDQAVVVDALRQSFDFAREVIAATPNDGLWVQAPNAGSGTTVGSQLILLQFHAHEHLGQMVAYARVNQIVPPWSN